MRHFRAKFGKYKVTVGFSIMSTYDDKVEKVKFEYKSIVDYFF